MKRLRVSARAARDVDGIWLYLAEKSGDIEIATRVVDSIIEAFPLSPVGLKPGEGVTTSSRFYEVFRSRATSSTTGNLMRG